MLHNVGNVLNSVNLTATLLSNGIRTSRVSVLNDVVSAMDAHKDDIGEFISNNPKGRELPGFLSRLASVHSEEQSKQLEELEVLCKNVNHIKSIIREQQRYAKVSGFIETVSAADLVEDAIRINAASLKKHAIELKRDFLDLPLVKIDKHQVLQVLVNIIRNAKQAIVEANTTQKQLRIHISKTDSPRTQIKITDNGIGIPPENLQKIFNHGFTTKKNGHGFGLHSGALDLKNMGGDLSVYSDGPGHGTTFTLELPGSTQA